MPRSSYDIVVLGTDLPGLVLGALAAKKGYRVLVLGHGGRETIYEVEGFNFVRRPHILYGFSDSNPVREVFRELALAPEMRNLPRPLSPTCSVVLPDARVEVTHLKGVFEEEMSREFPDGLEAFRALTAQAPELEKQLEPLLSQCPVLPPGTIKEYLAYRRLKKALRPLLQSADAGIEDILGSNPGLKAVFAGPMAFMSGLAEPHRFTVPGLRLLNHLLRGFYHVEWGLDSLKKLFLERIRGNSGDVRTDDWADMLVLKRGRVAEIEVRARDEAIGVGVLVASTSIEEALDLIPGPSAKRRYKAKIDKIAPSHYMVTTNIGARREVVPEGMARTAFVVGDQGRPFEGANLVAIQVDPAMEPADVTDPGRAVLSVSAMIPAGDMDGKAATVETFSNKMLEAARRVLPFLDDHVEVISCAAIGSHPKTGQPVIDPAGLVPVYPEPVPRSMDLVTWPVRTAYKNMLHLGDESAGALGFEGAFVAAFAGFEIVKGLIPLKSAM